MTSTQRTRGPERFAAEPVAPARPGAARVAGALLALLALLAGVPALLVLATGAPPVPSGLPGREALTQPLSVEALVTVLVAVVWLAWLQFATCVLVEAVSLVRDGGLPRPVPLSGRSQALARALVGTVLVGTSFLGTSAQAAQAVTADAGQAVGAVTTAAPAVADGSGPQDRAEDPSAADQRVDGGQGADPSEDRGGRQRMQHVPGVPPSMTDVIGHKVAVVSPPEGRYHDNLWDIAERHLDDGRRWKEIYELNKGRTQPDGGELVIGRLIQPGWVLIMPEDATGVPRVQVAQEEAAGPGERADRAPVADGDRAAEQGGAAVEEAAGGSTSVQATLGGGLLAAGLLGMLLVLRRRRRSVPPEGAALEAEVALRAGADRERAMRLDAALRSLGDRCRAERVPLPQVFAASVDEEGVELRVLPTSATAPAPWSVRDSGRRWRLEATEVVEGEGHAPFPGLVCLGRDDAGADVLVDLEAVGGPLSVTGALVVATELVSALAAQLTCSPWSDDQLVWAHGLDPALAEIGGDRVEQVDSLDGLMESWSEHAPNRPSQDVLGGRLGRHPGDRPQYLVLGHDPGDEVRDRLHSLTGVDARGLGVVAAADLPGSRWRLTVDDHGRLRFPLLDLDLDAVRLSATGAQDLAALVEGARTPSPAREGRAPVPQPPHRTDDGHWSTAAVRVGVLGPLDVRTGGRIDPARLDLAVEMATFLAVQPEPVHPSVVAASLWPSGVTADVRDATIDRVRDWLGEDADGTTLLREGPDGRLSLAPGVAVDWWAFCALLRQSREVGGSVERDLLWRALRLVRGTALEGRPDRRYAWVPRTRLEHDAEALVVDAGLRLAALSTDDDPEGASAGLRVALRLAVSSQALWRALLLAEHRRPDGPGAAAVAEEMVVALHLLGVQVEPETEALVEELVPDRDPGAQAG